jgi:radical SAM protein with 4Fe4S-binding SPASM domain
MKNNKKSRFSRLHFEITGICNLRCKHCYNANYLGQSKELSALEIKQILDKAKKIGCKTFAFSGGEPLCRKDILEIIKYAGDPVIILTNSYNLTDKILNQISKIDKTIEFRVSWDGYKGHLFIRNQSWKPVLKNIKKLVKSGFIVTVNSSLIRQNVDELERMYETIKSLKVDRWRIDVPYLRGNFLNNAPEMNVDLEKVFPKIQKLVKRFLKEKPKLELDIIQAFRSQLLRQKIFFAFNRNSHPCAYRRVLAIRPDGGMSYCATWDKVFGNLLNEKIEDIIQKKEWREFEEIQIKDLKKCAECRYLNICGGGCRARALYSTGDLLAPDPLACKVHSLSEKYIWPLLSIEIKEILYSSLKK